MKDVKVDPFVAILAFFLLLLAGLTGLLVMDKNALDHDLHHCLNLERDAAVARCVTSVAGNR